MDVKAAKVVFLMRIVGVAEVIKHRDCFDETFHKFATQGRNAKSDDGPTTDEVLAQFVVEASNLVDVSHVDLLLRPGGCWKRGRPATITPRQSAIGSLSCRPISEAVRLRLLGNASKCVVMRLHLPLGCSRASA